MANRLKVGWVQAIETLLTRGWSHRRIARTLGIDRGTVARYARRARAPDVGGLSANAAGAPPGSEGGAAADSTVGSDPNAAKAPLGSPSSQAVAVREAPPGPLVQPSQCEPFREVILAKLELGLSAKRIHQDLVREHGFAAVDRACEIAQTHGAYRLRTIRKLMKHNGVPQEQFEFIHEHPIIRKLSDYGDLVRSALQETAV